MRKTIILFLLVFVFAKVSFSQVASSEFTKYTPLKSAGVIPADFMSVLEAKYEQDKSTLNNNETRRVRKKQEHFLIESNFIINRLLLSGKILFNDPVSEYISKVADNVLKNNKELRSQLRFYVAKSPAVNAFSTDKGIITINLGLIAQLENEAQLAFVIAHEVVHYAKKHNMNMFLEKDKIISGGKSYRNASIDERYLAVNYRSREMENEADKSGLIDYYANSDYSLAAINSVFDVLQYAYLPFDDVDFNRSFFEYDPNMRFPDLYFNDEPNPIKGKEDYDDKKSTHPNIKSRRETIEEMVLGMNNTDKKDFVQSKDAFSRIRDLARFETIRLQVIDRQYEEAIYNAFILSKSYPNNKFIRRVVVSSLYSLSVYKNGFDYNKVKVKVDQIEGKSHKVYHFFDKISNIDLNALALKFAWQYRTDFPGDTYINNICDELIRSLVFESEFKLEELSSVSRATLKINAEKEFLAQDSTKASKYDKIKQQKKIQDTSGTRAYRFFFVDNLKDTAFKRILNYYYERTKFSDKNTEISTSVKKARQKAARLERKYGKALGIDSVILFNPFYLTIDKRKKNNIRYLDSDKKQEQLTGLLSENAKAAQINAIPMAPRTFAKSDVDRFNEMALMNDWLNERFEHEDIEIIPYSSGFLTDITNKYHTKYANFIGVINYKVKKFESGMFCCFSIVYPPLLVYFLLRSNSHMHFYSVVFDFERGGVLMENVADIRKKGSTCLYNSLLFDSFHQIKQRRKKK